jgi:phosphatidylglycerophosphate synthase
MSHNTLIHMAVRPAVGVAAKTGVQPNHVTTLRLVTGLGAAVLFAKGQYGWMASGAFVFMVSLLLDRADGALARQTGRTSLAGHRYDLISDCIASIATFLGLGVGVAGSIGPTALGLGALAAAGIGGLFVEINILKAASVGGHTLFGGRVTIDEDDAMILVPIFVWCGLAWPMLVVAATVTPLASLWVAISCLRRRSSGAPVAKPEI